MGNTSGTGAGVHWSGTLHSFNNNSTGPQDLIHAKINSGRDSGNLITGSSYYQTQVSTWPSGESRSAAGTQSSFEAYRSGPQYFIYAAINSGENSGNRSRADVSRTIRGRQQQQLSQSGSSGTTGTQRSFENHSSNPQIFYCAKINSGANSGDRMPQEWGPTMQSNNECSGTLGSFNNYGNGSQDFTNADINSGARGTRHYYNHESTQLSFFLGIGNVLWRTLLPLPKFYGSNINSNKNSGGR